METQIIFEAIKEIRNAVVVINGELGAVQIDVAVLKAQVSEIMWTTRAIVGAFVVLFASQIWRVIVSYRNNRNGKK